MKGQLSNHIGGLLQEAFDKSHVYLQQEMQKGPDKIDRSFFWNIIGMLNYNVFGRLGFIILHPRVFSKAWEKYRYYDESKWRCSGALYDAFMMPEKLEEVYDLFRDQASQDIFNWLVKYKASYTIIGEMAGLVFPSPDSPNFPTYSMLSSKVKRRGAIYQFKDYQIEGSREIFDTWIKNQYQLEGKCEVVEGDVIISAGAYYGETSVWFADKVEKKGKVYAFEPSPLNLLKLRRNIQSNSLDDIVKIIDKGLWDKNTVVCFQDKGGGSCCHATVGDKKVEVVNLDAFVASEGLKKIDMIKMDIEGAELNALKGARETIIRYKPKLVIAVYHLPSDLTEIPLYIKSLVPEYRLYLSHKSHNVSETILFAVVER